MFGFRRNRLVQVSAMVVTAGVALAAAGCGADESVTGARQVVLVTHDSFNVSASVLEEFEKVNDIKVVVKSVGDAGTLANQLVFTKDAPLGDVVFGVDNTYASRVVNGSVLAPYAASNGSDSSEYDVDDSRRLHAIDFSEVCVNIDPAYFVEHALPAPRSYEDLTKPEYRDLLVVQNPATSSPGLAFLIGTIASQGEDSYLEYWKRLKANGVKVTDDWTSAYSVDFSGSSGRGSRPLVVSYLSSPYVEIPEGGTVPPTGVLTETCTRQVEYAGLIAGGDNSAGAKLLEFLLSDEFQVDIPGQMYMYPVSKEVALPELWSANPMPKVESNNLPSTLINENRQAWIKDWAEVVIE